MKAPVNISVKNLDTNIFDAKINLPPDDDWPGRLKKNYFTFTGLCIDYENT